MYQGFKQLAARFVKDEEGATAIEYSIIAGLMAVALAGFFAPAGSLGAALVTAYSKIVAALPH